MQVEAFDRDICTAEGVRRKLISLAAVHGIILQRRAIKRAVPDVSMDALVLFGRISLEANGQAFILDELPEIGPIGREHPLFVQTLEAFNEYRCKHWKDDPLNVKRSLEMPGCVSLAPADKACFVCSEKWTLFTLLDCVYRVDKEPFVLPVSASVGKTLREAIATTNERSRTSRFVPFSDQLLRSDRFIDHSVDPVTKKPRNPLGWVSQDKLLGDSDLDSYIIRPGDEIGLKRSWYVHGSHGRRR